MLKEARAQSMGKRLGDDVRKSLRNLTKSWRKPIGDATQDEIVEDANPDNSHTYSHVQNSGEMNHMGRHECDFCEGEMKLLKRAAGVSSGEQNSSETAEDYYWQCLVCGRQDDTSFRVCSKCGKKTVSDKWAASARELPVSLNAGGCTDCEHCILCDGILAIGNLMWFHGRWTHSYPSPEFERRTGEQIMVTRERSKTYGFHAHHSCHEKKPTAVAQIILQRTPEWYKQGEAQQQRAESARLRKEGRCQRCKNPLSFWDRVLERDQHKQCR